MEAIIIAREVAKNLLMRSFVVRALRSRTSAGRTTGSYSPERAVDHCLLVLEHLRQALDEAGLGRDYLAEKRVLEIGPGATLGVELALIAEGAQEAHALDRFRDKQESEKEAAIYGQLRARFPEAGKARIDEVYDTKDGLPHFKEPRIQYFGGCGLEDAPMSVRSQYDFCFSHLALEHVSDLSRSIASMAKLLKPGGVCAHICNLVSLGGVYRHEQEPLRLLNYSETVWNMMFSNRGGSNRARAHEYLRLFRENGFTVLSFKPLRQLAPEDLARFRPAFNKKFRDLTDEDLRILMFRVVARAESPKS